jgi:hypothetical protein
MELQTKKLWGVNAPPEYATRMGGAVSKIDRIVLYALWIVRIEELDRTKLPSSDHLPAIDAVEVRTELRQQVQNISDVGWEFEDPWIARSLAGFPRSCFTRLELSVERPGGEVGDKTPMVWSADELSAATGDQAVPRLTYSKDGVTYIGIKDLLNSRAKLPPGATASIHQEGCSHQPAIGGLPLVNRMPSLTTTIRIEGSARSRLEIQVYSGSERLAPTGDSSYTSGGFTYPQHTFRIEWFPKTSSPDEETPPQEATI